MGQRRGASLSLGRGPVHEAFEVRHKLLPKLSRTQPHPQAPSETPAIRLAPTPHVATHFSSMTHQRPAADDVLEADWRRGVDLLTADPPPHEQRLCSEV